MGLIKTIIYSTLAVITFIVSSALGQYYETVKLGGQYINIELGFLIFIIGVSVSLIYMGEALNITEEPLEDEEEDEEPTPKIKLKEVQE